MPTELDIQCAKALGYTVYHYDKDYAENCYYQLVDRQLNPVVSFPFRAGEQKTEAEAWDDAPEFSINRDATSLLEDEIERRNLPLTYLDCLAGIAAPSINREDWRVWWGVVRATPDQKARAFLEAIAPHITDHQSLIEYGAMGYTLKEASPHWRLEKPEGILYATVDSSIARMI